MKALISKSIYSKSLIDPFEINRDIEAISGATILRAIVRACQALVLLGEVKQ